MEGGLTDREYCRRKEEAKFQISEEVGVSKMKREGVDGGCEWRGGHRVRVLEEKERAGGGFGMQAGRVPTERAVIWATSPTRPSD